MAGAEPAHLLLDRGFHQVGCMAERGGRGSAAFGGLVFHHFAVKRQSKNHFENVDTSFYDRINYERPENHESNQLIIIGSYKFVSTSRLFKYCTGHGIVLTDTDGKLNHFKRYASEFNLNGKYHK